MKALILSAALAAMSAPAPSEPTRFPVQALCQGNQFVGIQAVVPQAGPINIVWGDHNPCKKTEGQDT